MFSQKGKYKEARKNWILLVNIHLIVLVMSVLLYYILSDDTSAFFGLITIGITISLLINMWAYKINPHYYRNKNNSIED